MQVELILYTYRQRYNQHAKQGQVYIFHNRGHEAGESIHHPHSQLVVVPFDVKLSTPQLSTVVTPQVVNEDMPFFTQKWWGISQPSEFESIPAAEERVETEHFYITCPASSEWPDEVWIAPKQTGHVFGEITEAHIKDLAFVLQRIIQIFDLRHGNAFPFNFYIYPGENWYLRLVPRIKVLGGFEVGTSIMVNTQEPAQTMAFIKEHFTEPNHEKIRTQHQADYRKKV
jgi:UDPglucose--hexose-1-phosphate uridylyltransferase